MKLYLGIFLIVLSYNLKSQQVIHLKHDSVVVFKYFDDEWKDTLYVPWSVLRPHTCNFCKSDISFIVSKNELKVSEFQIKGDSIYKKYFYYNGKIRAYNISHKTTMAWLYKEYYYENGQKWKSLVLTPDSLFPYTEYWENGQIKLEANYYSGAYWNRTRGYHKNGKLNFEGQYKSFPSHYKELNFEASTKKGIWQFFDPKGTLVETKNFK